MAMDLYHNNMSVCSQKVRLVLREKKLTPDEHHLNLRAGDQSRPEYLALNPNAVVPTLVDRGRPIIESTVICEYLDDAYPDQPLRPSDHLERAAMRIWTLIPDAGLHGACSTVSFSIAFRHQLLALGTEEMERRLAQKTDPVARERQRRGVIDGVDAPGVADAFRIYARVLSRMDERLCTAEWLTGAAYSLADAAMLPYVVRLEQLQMSWLWRDRHPRIEPWLERSKSRENFTGISDYLDPRYLDLMASLGKEARQKVEKLVAR
jgi:glutathione S-transferase